MAETRGKRKQELKPPEYPRSSNPQYISSGGKEYVIETKGYFFFIKPWGGGLMPLELQGLFTTYSKAEQALMSYLRTTDKIGNAKWPGKSYV